MEFLSREEQEQRLSESVLGHELGRTVIAALHQENTSEFESDHPTAKAHAAALHEADREWYVAPVRE